MLPGRRLDFFDPWGNRFEVVDYRDIQFDRVPGVKRKLGIEGLEKRDSARAEIRGRGLE
jgi:lactoylglutathione lyase